MGNYILKRVDDVGFIGIEHLSNNYFTYRIVKSINHALKCENQKTAQIVMDDFAREFGSSNKFKVIEVNH
jgi:hypothetical protein